MRETCAGCQHLVINRLPMAGRIASCQRNDHIVPQHSEQVGDKWRFTFWRVPMSCPLPDTEVKKSEDKAPQKKWVVVNEPMESR